MAPKLDKAIVKLFDTYEGVVDRFVEEIDKHPEDMKAKGLDVNAGVFQLLFRDPPLTYLANSCTNFAYWTSWMEDQSTSSILSLEPPARQARSVQAFLKKLLGNYLQASQNLDETTLDNVFWNGAYRALACLARGQMELVLSMNDVADIGISDFGTIFWVAERDMAAFCHAYQTGEDIESAVASIQRNFTLIAGNMYEDQADLAKLTAAGKEVPRPYRGE